MCVCVCVCVCARVRACVCGREHNYTLEIKASCLSTLKLRQILLVKIQLDRTSVQLLIIFTHTLYKLVCIFYQRVTRTSMQCLYMVTQHKTFSLIILVNDVRDICW